MRLLQKSLRSLILYALILVVISVPVSLFSIRAILNEEIDESLSEQSDQFLNHIKRFTYLDDLETDLSVLDQLSGNIHIKPSKKLFTSKRYETISLYDSLEHESRPYRQLSTGVNIKGKEYLLTVQMSVVDNDKLVFVIALVQTLLILLLVGGLLLLNRSLSRKLWEPFYSTLSRLKAFELDKSKSIEPATTGIVEFDDLNKTVNHLTDRSRKVFLQQKEFIENASHELQTPLAIFQLKLDTLMQHSGLEEKDANTIMELEESVKRMVRLNKNLLLLSKIDNEQFSGMEEIDMSVLITSLLSNLQTFTEGDQITIDVKVDPLVMKANRTLTEVLLTNLFHNAIRHTKTNGSIYVKLHDQLLSVSNTGEPLKMSTERLFERFTKESTGSASTGLGLAIVKKICDTCSYGLSYEYKNDLHVFLIKF
ncbi:HAMP domain-containing sensor histidine kinase [soil metagenome]